MSDPATTFVLQAIQEWGQTTEARIGAVQGVLDAAGFRSRAMGYPIFGGLWSARICEGSDEVAARVFLKHLTDTMPRGHFEDGVAHVNACIETEAAERPAAVHEEPER